MRRILVVVGLALCGSLAAGACTVTVGVGGGSYDCSTCGELLAGSSDMLCSGEETYYADLLACACDGRCAGACARDRVCNAERPALPACDDCLRARAGCAREIADCE